jgi:hypothetical protein
MGEGVWASLMSEAEWGDLSEAPLIADVHHIGQNGSQPIEDSWLPRNLALVPDEPPVLPTLGGLNLIYPGKRHVFSGPQEAAKTLAAYVVGLSVVREGGRVMLIDFEMGERDAKQRLRELGATDEELPMFDYIEPETPLTPAKAGELVALEPSLVLIDASAGAYDLQSLDDNKRGDVERFASLYIRPFWRHEIATLTIDHVVKNTEQRGNYAIGSERKVGGVDVHLGFTVIQAIKRGSAGKYQITTHKDRGGFHKRGKLATFELDSDPDTHHFTWEFVAAPMTDETHPFRPTHLMEKVSRFIERQVEAVSRNTVEEEKLGGRDYVRTAMDVLTEEGYLQESEGPRRARLLTLNRVYREDSDDFAATSPDFAEIRDETTSPLRRSPYGGGEDGEVRGTSGEVTSPSLLGDDDGIPF